MKLLNTIVVIALIAPAALVQPFDSLRLAQGSQAVVSGSLMLRGVVMTSSDVPLARVRVAVPVDVPPQLVELGAFPESAPGVLTDDRGRFTLQVPAASTPIRLTFAKARYATRTTEISPRELTAGSDIRVRL